MYSSRLIAFHICEFNFYIEYNALHKLILSSRVVQPLPSFDKCGDVTLFFRIYSTLIGAPLGVVLVYRLIRPGILST